MTDVQLTTSAPSLAVVGAGTGATVAIVAGTPGTLTHNLVVLVNPGTDTFTVPDNVRTLTVHIWGAGGGGAFGAGGGGGGYTCVVLAVVPGQAIPFIVGVGGPATIMPSDPSSNVGNGGRGATSWFGSNNASGGLGGRSVNTNPGLPPLGSAPGTSVLGLDPTTGGWGQVASLTSGNVTRPMMGGGTYAYHGTAFGAPPPGTGGTGGWYNTTADPINPPPVQPTAGGNGILKIFY